MSPVIVTVSVVYAILCIGLITVILMQKKRSAGVGSLSGMGGSNTYWDKNKSRSREGRLELITKIGAVLFYVFPLIIALIQK